MSQSCTTTSLVNVPMSPSASTTVNVTGYVPSSIWRVNVHEAPGPADVPAMSQA